MLLSRKSLGRLAALALEDLESRTKNEITSITTGRRKSEKVVVLGQRDRYVAANIARETTHDKDKKSAPGATAGITSASRARRLRGE